jgi:hypothetical protein
MPSAVFKAVRHLWSFKKRFVAPQSEFVNLLTVQCELESVDHLLLLPDLGRLAEPRDELR